MPLAVLPGSAWRPSGSGAGGVFAYSAAADGAGAFLMSLHGAAPEMTVSYNQQAECLRELLATGHHP
jgi:hypothetical protein